MVKNKLKKLLAGAAAIASVIAVSGTYAYFSDTISVVNHISTGDVNISLAEYELVDGKEVSYSNPKQVVPGDIVSKIPRITNLAEPCWIRAKVTYSNGTPELEGFSDANISGIPEEWIKQGEYYYYTKILDHQKTIDLFDQVKIPDIWTEEHAGQQLAINIQTDAVQAANFEPDFSAMSPWGDQEIELCIHEENGSLISRKEKIKLSVEFNGEAHKLIAVPDDFFSNFQTAMPGDSFQDSVTVSNTTDREAEIFFRTGIENQTDEQRELLEKLDLMISMDGKKLYSGNLLAESLNKDVSLGKFKPGQSGQLDFSVSVPSELNNAYALRSADVKWIFTVNEDEPEPTVTPTAQDHLKGTDAVKTGDSNPLVALISLIVIAGAVIGFVLVRKGGKK